ncbi:TrlF family AAA-like ATPase [Klebsiella variicola]
MQQKGSKWWKFDFHTHTPASMDYGKADHQIKHTMTPRQWLLDYIAQGIECIAVTDHNTGSWIDTLKSEAEILRSEGHSIYIFPGIEITSHGNIHILGIFDLDRTSSYISQIIGATNYSGTEGDSDEVTQSSPQEVIDIIIDRGGVAIPAHIDKPSGLCKVHPSGATLKQILTKASAVEIIKTHAEYEAIQPNSSPLSGFVSFNTGLPEVLGSDSHHPNTVGRAFTWIKMGTPSIEGLKLALFDGGDSLKRSDQFPDSPNIFAENRITSIKVNKTKYCGRSKEFQIEFHPWLNCIIGGRGSGKSTILEFIRTALGRENELERLSSNREMYNSYINLTKKPKNREDDGVFLDDSSIQIEYLKGENRYILDWKYPVPKVLINRIDGNNIISEEGEVTSRFPVKIFSQKQIYEISRSPNYLLNIIDESHIVNINDWKYKWDIECNTLSQLRKDVKDLRTNILTKTNLTGQLNDVNQKIASIERSSHASILAIYQKTLNQVNAINHFATKNIAFLEDLLEHIQLTKPESFITDDELFNTQNEIDAKNKITVLQQKIDNSITEFNGSIDATIIEIRELIQWFDSSPLKQDISNHQTQYTNLISTLQANGVNNPNEYEALINSRKQIKERLDKIEIDEKTIETKKTSITESYNKLVELRKELTSRRRQFLVDINNDNTNFKVSVDFCGDKQFLESSFRNAIDKKDSTFSNEIYNEDGNGFLNVFNAQIKEISEDMDAINQKIRVLKNEFLNKESNTILDVRLSKRFSDFKNDLTDEVITSLICWFPSDAITVKYNDGRRFKDLSQGSAGQKAATVLAFLLSYGDDPIILDQPEDDLDNQLVYELIVKKIKESKSKRQIIIVTHNPNIVVNGDSELVISLSQQSGTTDFLSLGGLQEREVRQTICDIMEGGKDAFSQRYRRIVTA